MSYVTLNKNEDHRDYTVTERVPLQKDYEGDTMK